MLEYRLLSSVLFDGYSKEDEDEDEEGIAIANKDRVGKEEQCWVRVIEGGEGGIVGSSIQYCFIAGS